MKKIGLGISILLFAILFQLCSSGLDFAALIIGIIGIGFVVIGFLSSSNV